MKITLCCFAAQRYWQNAEELKNAFGDIKAKLENLCTECFLIDDSFDIDSLSGDLLIAIPMSGGVQPNVLKTAEKFKNVLLYAGYIKDCFGKTSEKMLINNAAPAVMDVYAVLKRKNINISLAVSGEELKKRIRAVCTVEKLKNSRLLAIGETEPWVISTSRDWDVIKKRFGIEIINVSQDELAELYGKISDEEASEFCKQWNDEADYIAEPTETDVLNASKFQVALIKLIEKYGASGAAIACFNLLKTGTTSCLGVSYINTYTDYVVSCEGDMDSAVTMLIMKNLAKDSVWMANPNIQPDGTVNFVHCTAPTVIGGKKCKYILRNHHESGIGVSTQVDLPENAKMTVCRISNNMTQMTVHSCTGTHGEYEPSCRTQLKIKFDDFNKYIKNVMGCHQIFVFCDIKKELAYVAEMTGIEILK